VNYYKRHVGDYAKKAGHLSVLEHGVYTLLLDAYYDREQAPTRAEAVRISRCRTPDELAALDAVLADFFVLVDGRYVQARVEEEFVLAEQAAQRNRDNGKAGGRPRKPKGNPLGSERVTSGNPNESEKNPNPLIHQSTNPEKQKQGRASAPPCPEDVDPQTWTDWLALRRAKRAPVTATVVREARAEAGKAGMTFGQFLAVWCRRGSQGLEADWLKPNERAGPAAPPQAGKQMQGLMALEAMKRERMAGNRNPDGAAETGVPLVGSDSGG